MERLRHPRRRVAAIVAAAVVVAVAVPTAFALLRGGEEAASGERSAGSAASAHDAHPVAGKFEPDGQALDDCEPRDRPCIEQAFGNLAYEAGPQEALAEFDRAMASDTDVEANCHRIVHTIGSASLARFDGNVAEAFAAGSASCWSGYYHGILERAFTGVSTDEVGGVARELCSDESIQGNGFLFYQCVHGLGHGLMIYSGYDLPWSLSICDGLATPWEQSSCTGGIFMENISTSYGVRSNWVRDDDPVYPCQAVKERHKLYCYLMVTSRINELNGFRWRETANTCRTVEPTWVGTCFESYGRDASGYTRQDPQRIAELCSYTRPQQASCIYGAARDITSNDAGGERAAKLCAIVASRFRAQCYNGVGTILGSLHATEADRRAACAEVAPRLYRASCLAGSGVDVAV